MAAFKTTSVATPRATQPTIVQRFLLTSGRFLLSLPGPRCALPVIQARVAK